MAFGAKELTQLKPETMHVFNPYGATKALGENLGRWFFDTYGLEFLAVRIGYFGGPVESVVSCVQGHAQGYKCSYSEESEAYPKLTSILRAKGRTSCTVSAARGLGFSPDEDFVEVGCSDGLPGWVIAFKSQTSTVTDLLNCSQAEDIAGGCKLPSNTKKK